VNTPGVDSLDLFSEPPESPPAEPPPEEAAPPPVWSVSDVNRAVRTLIEKGFGELWVGGEVANWTRARSGHCYFTLKDEQAQLRCVLWRRDAARLPVDPEEGMRVRAFGSLTVYEARGDVQLAVRRLEGEGVDGLWKLAFERLRGRLEAEGLLDPARKRPIPRFPGTVGIVTSPTGAALHDILTVLGKRAPWTRVVLRGARVQGEGASAELAAAVRLLAGSGEVDVLIVGRGGGSTEDLWAFNEEPLARAIAESPVPVISAVGHEVDVTICDLVADLRAPTPSAAAEAAVQDGRALEEVLQGIRPRMSRALRHQVDRRRHRVDAMASRAIRGVQRLVEPRRRQWARAEDRLGTGMRRLLHFRRERLGTLSAKVDSLSPLSTLRRGYAVPIGEGGRVLRRTQDFRGVLHFDLRIVDGRIRCETLDIQEEVSE